MVAVKMLKWFLGDVLYKEKRCNYAGFGVSQTPNK